MKILLYLLIPLLIVAAAAVFTWLRNRQPTSLEHGVQSFRREMEALSPHAAPTQRRRPEVNPPTRHEPPRRPPGADRS